MDPYADMLELPHHVSKRRPHMSMIDRGAQFSPFAALTGYEKVIAESARLTEEGTELTEGAVEALDEILRALRDRIAERPYAEFTCFQPDSRKAGGAYVRICGRLKKMDCLRQQLLLEDGTVIPFSSILSISGQDGSPTSQA